MFIKSIISSLFKAVKKVEAWSIAVETPSIYAEMPVVEEKKTFFSVWDALRFKEHTQAYHLNSVIGFEEWVDMEEILRRIREIFGVEYKNFRSLYPYLKTISDIGLMETTSAGGRRKWRKVVVLVPAQREEVQKQEVKAEIKKKREKEN